MPNFDGGHYYLTVIAPIAVDVVVEKNGMERAPIQMVRNALANLPTALQTKATEHIGINSPFSRNTRTHFARFAVIEDVMYNGRDPEDAVEIAVRGVNPVLPRPQDRLSCPFLLFVADFDAARGDANEVKGYLRLLWSTMEAELREVFQYCLGFEKVKDDESFARFIQRCQIETTMPFNDYWTTAPPLKSLSTLLVGVPVAGLAIGAWLARRGHSSWAGILGGALAGGIAGGILSYFIVMTQAKRPFPAAPNSDLPSVLKALYLQQHFTRLAIEAQGASDEDLYQRFAVFLEDHRPLEAAPRQSPGIIRS